MAPSPSGMLVIDKPSGPTSHDVVSRVRRALGTRTVGHAGTLDPMASGVLLVMIGECTKLSRYLTLERKSYEARVCLGVETDTLDAEGKETRRCELGAGWVEQLEDASRGALPDRIARALQQERARTEQVPPAFSAIKQEGVRAYALARRGVEVVIPSRPVHVFELELIGASPSTHQLDFRMLVSKGYYVRSFARDLGLGLGLPAHLTSLRRTSTGDWTLERAVPLDALKADAPLVPTAEVARVCMPSAKLTTHGARRAVCGQTLGDEDFLEVPPQSGPSVWFDEIGALVAVGERIDGRPVVARGFVPGTV